MKIISILKVEAAAFFIATVWAYYLIGASWWLFLILLLVPDLFMVGYAKNSKLGALLYNIGHTYTVPVALLGVYVFFNVTVLLPISIIWLAHISMDRMLGYGLKLETGFKHTHLGTIGKNKE
ncbi:MAG: DUF4260 domain-containing protein [Minisyncoccia bacterium]